MDEKERTEKLEDTNEVGTQDAGEVEANEQAENVLNEQKEPTIKEESSESSEKTPTVQELLVRIAKLEHEKDKNASEAASWKKKYRATQSEKEVIDAEAAEAEAAKQAEYEDMKRTIRIHDLTENYMDLGYSKDLAKKAATAEVDNDLETKFKIQKMVDEAKRKNWEKEFLKNRPDLQAGNGEEQAKDPFMEGFNSVK